MKKYEYNSGFAVIIVFIIAAVLIIAAGLTFFVIPHRGNPNAIEPFNRKDGYMFAEKISYLFRNPKVGDAIIFVPTAGEKVSGGADFIGIIIQINEEKEVRTYQVVSVPGKPWKITADKIKERIYYPQVTKVNLDQALSQITSKSPIATPSAYPIETPDPTADWESYTDVVGKFTIKYPPTRILRSSSSFKEEISMGMISITDIRESLKSGKNRLTITVSQDTLENAQKVLSSWEKQYNGSLSTTVIDGANGYKLKYTYIDPLSTEDRVEYRVSKNNLLYSFEIAGGVTEIQILSTFKFTE